MKLIINTRFLFLFYGGYFMYEDIFKSIRHAAEKRNLRERTIQLYCSDVSYFLRCTNKPVADLTLGDADAFLTMKRLEGRSPETHNHYRSSIKFLYKRVLKIAWDDDEVPAMKRERNLPSCPYTPGNECGH